MSRRLLISAAAALAIAVPATAQAAPAPKSSGSDPSPSFQRTESLHASAARAGSWARQCAKLRKRGRRCVKKRGRKAPVKRQPGTPNRPGPVQETWPVDHSVVEIPQWRDVPNGFGGTTRMYMPLKQSTLANSAGPLVGRSAATGGDQYVMILYIVQQWDGGKWFTRTRQDLAVRIPGGASVVRMPQLNISPTFGNLVRVVHLIVWSADTPGLPVLGVREYVPQHRCQSLPAHCQAFDGYLRLTVS